MRPWSFDDGNHESTITRPHKQPVFFEADLLFKILFAKFFRIQWSFQKRKRRRYDEIVVDISPSPLSLESYRTVATNLKLFR